MGRTVTAAGIALGALALLWWLLDGSAAYSPTLGREADDLEGSGSTLRQTDERSSATRQPTLGGAGQNVTAAAVLLPAGSYVVEGLVLKADGTPEAAAHVSTRGHGLDLGGPREVIHGASDSEGRYELDVTRLFRAPSIVVELEIEASHGPAWPARRRISVSGASRLARRETWRLDLRLARGAAVRGRLVDVDGKVPRGARARLFPRIDDKPVPNLGLRQSPAEEADGSFVLAARSGGSFLLLCTAPGLATTAVEVELRPGKTTDLGAIELGPGAALKGRLRVNGVPAVGVALTVACAASSTIQLKRRGRRGGGALWREDGVFTASAHARTDGQGYFTLSGLAEERYWLRIGRSKAFLVHPDLWRPGGLDAYPPDEDVQIDLEGAWVNLLVLGPDGQPARQARCQVSPLSMGPDLEGRIRLLLPPQRKLSLWIRAPGMSGARPEVETGAIGSEQEVVVALSPSAAPAPQHGANIRFVPTGRGAEAVDLLGVGLYRMPRRYVDLRYIISPHVQRTLHRSKGVFLLEGVPEGTWHLAVRPGGSWDGGEGHHLLVTRTIEVPSRGMIEQEIPLKPAGRLRVDPRTKEGAPLISGCRILDAAGKDVQATFSWRAPREAGRGPYPSGVAPYTVHPALPAGTYTVRFTASGFQEKRVRVEVAAGQTLDVVAFLERRP